MVSKTNKKICFQFNNSPIAGAFCSNCDILHIFPLLSCYEQARTIPIISSTKLNNSSSLHQDADLIGVLNLIDNHFQWSVVLTPTYLIEPNLENFQVKSKKPNSTKCFCFVLVFLFYFFPDGSYNFFFF